VYTADFSPDRIIEFLLLNEEFPHSLRYSIDSLHNALEAIHGEGGKRRAVQLTRLGWPITGLRLSFGQISEILSQDVDAYLQGILGQLPRDPRDHLRALCELLHPYCFGWLIKKS